MSEEIKSCLGGGKTIRTETVVLINDFQSKITQDRVIAEFSVSNVLYEADKRLIDVKGKSKWQEKQ